MSKTPEPQARDLPHLTKIKWKTPDRFLIEREMIRLGGKVNGIGEGLAYHYKAAISALWPWFDWHKWSHLLIEEFVQNAETPVMGPASSGKTFCAAAYSLTKFFVYPKGTSILMSSTTKEMLELRVWGEVKKLFNDSKRRRQYLPGRLLQSRMMLTGSDSDDEAQDFRDGIIGVACKVGNQWVGISNYVGVKNYRMMLVADEASLMGRGFLDALANLRKGAKAGFQAIFLGNPKDRTDALGAAAEPAVEIGGWDGHNGEAITQVWPTRAKGGRAVQLCGWDSPNYDHPRGLNPHPGIITPEMIDADLAYYGENSLQFSMMNLGIMPKDGSGRRVMTRQLATTRDAFEQAIWDGKTTDILSLDAAYRGVGGDRCALTHLRMGKCTDGVQRIAYAASPIVVPIIPASTKTPEEQISTFIKSYATKHQISPSHIGLDSTGRGTLVAELYKWSTEIVCVEFGGPPKERPLRDGDPKFESDAYGKFVSALWFASYYLVESGQLRNASSEAIDEACSREWVVNNNRTSRKSDPVIDVEPKDKTKKRLGRSPDLWDSFVVGLEVARQRGFKILQTTGSASGMMSKKDNWTLDARSRFKSMVKAHQLSPV